ncbi:MULTISPECIES: hypothetical protein [unclassified Bradyrhizobium]|uniref:hypothetical protein n=1 Tax=unclassified Bradyrhizobium TaxID=2631580 RepID=UPI0024783B35|nr:MULTISPECIES: hypothetical protein [unclassified Bradyrhizobium]WGS23864.1 hypothetical protein MTX22_16335 [Bradyrhizobium sp. ISRA463]WGS31176.1 hypothetical protein MTX19_14060 [Bradyrhizobium sp. ISRA464]
MTGRSRRRLPFDIRSTLSVALLTLAAAFVTAPAHADPCEDIAKQLAGQIEGLKVNFSAGNVTYLTHPAAKELSLGCRGKDYSTELYAKTDRKMKPQFFNLVGSATALVFTVPKDDTMTGTSRCLKRMGLLRGDKITMRYKRLNMECTRSRTEASITIRRGRNE